MTFKLRVLYGFEDNSFGSGLWNDLLTRSETDEVFLTWHWQRAWWDVFGRGTLLLIVAEKQGKTVLLAPLFAEEGMIFFIGSGGSDYLDFIGDTSDPEVLDAVLNAARNLTPNFVGFRFYLVPDTSSTGPRLQAAAARLRLDCFDEGELPAPALDMAGQYKTAVAATQKKTLLQQEKWLRSRAELNIQHFSVGEEILPHLEDFFQQHIDRWAVTPHPSLFLDIEQRKFYRHLTHIATDTSWLRFSRMDWNGSPVAFHFGFCYRGRYIYYKPSFALDLASRSPGGVLLRHLLLAAIEEKAHTFDFGLGEEEYKRRFATNVNTVRTWGLYPK